MSLNWPGQVPQLFGEFGVLRVVHRAGDDGDRVLGQDLLNGRQQEIAMDNRAGRFETRPDIITPTLSLPPQGGGDEKRA